MERTGLEVSLVQVKRDEAATICRFVPFFVQMRMDPSVKRLLSGMMHNVEEWCAEPTLSVLRYKIAAKGHLFKLLELQ